MPDAPDMWAQFPDHDPWHDPWGDYPDHVVSEEESFARMAPVDAFKMSMQLNDKTRVSPEMAEDNRQRNARDLLSIIPGPGNVISAEDAVTSAQDAAAAFGEGRYGAAAGNAALSALSAFGAVTGLPTSRMAGRAAGGAKDSVNAFPAWHGSPHDFDQFKLDKIGTGEGAQAYGHGLYFAENPSVAQSYRQQLGGAPEYRLDGGPLPDVVNSHALRNYAKMKVEGDEAGLRSEMQRLEKAISDQKLKMSAPSDDLTREVRELDMNDLQDQADGLRRVLSGKVDAQQRGRLYHTEIDAEPHQLLDWDKPLSEQSPEVQKALQPLMQKVAPDPSTLKVDFERGPIPMAERHGGHTRPGEYLVTLKAPGRGTVPGYGNSREEAYANALAEFTPKHGGGLYEAMARLNDGSTGQLWGKGSQPTSQALREAGIPGIRYLDQGSRGADGVATSNYVIFNDQLVKILGKQ